MAARVFIVGFVCPVVAVALLSSASSGLELGIGFSEEPSSTTAVRNKPLLLGCVPSTPATTVAWTLDDQPLQLDSRHHIQPNGSLYIKRVVHKKKGHGSSDAGIYRCTLRNNFGAIVSRPANVQIAGMSHEFSLSPENETILEGDAVRLTCTIDSVPPASIVWQRDFRPLPHNKRYVTTDSGVLYIINARKDDSGRYRCQATNSLIKKVRQSEDGLLTVIPGAGKFAGIEFLPDSPPSSATIRKGRNGSLVCAAKGHPRPSLAWTFTKMDGTNLTFQSTSNGLNILKIANMTRDNAGKYTCTAIQTIKESVTSSRKTVNLEFYVPPTIVRKPKSDEHPAAKTVRIDCEVQAVPMKNVTWLKDANKLHIDGRIRQKTKELILGDLVSQDTGIYQCIVGDQWGAGRLVVQTSINQPPPPTNVTCSSISATEVRISWFPPKVDDPSTMLLPYTVHHFPTDGGEEGKQISQNLTYIVNQLAPYTNYTFYVRAYNQYAASEQSMRATCSTFEAVPIGGPRVTVHAPASHCLTISWVPPPISLARGTITQYKVQWKCTNQNFTYFEILPGYIRRYSVTGLQEGQEYWVRVVGATSLGWPELSDRQAPWINITTPLRDSTELTPPELHLKAINMSTVLAEWVPVQDSIKGYHILYQKMSDETKETVTLLPNETSYMITGLEPATWYEVSISSFTSQSEGKICTENILTHEPFEIAKLPPPYNVEARSVSPHEIYVTWTAPRANVTHYTVYFSPLFKPPQESSKSSLQTNTTSARIIGLNAKTAYEVTIMAHGVNNDISIASSKLECRTLPEVTPAVENIQWQQIGGDCVKVSWNFLGHGLQHIIFYTSDQTSPLNNWHQIMVPRGSTYAEITGLNQNTQYIMKIQTTLVTGLSVLSNPVFFTIPLTDSEKNTLPPFEDSNQPPSNSSDQLLGILVGCGISACCIALCTGTLLYKRKCIKYTRNSATNSSNTQHPPCSAQHEMQSLTPFDTKGGNLNERTNGLKVPIIYNGSVPNGQARDNCFRITENPQYEVYKGHEGEGSRTTDEGDSLLSGPELEIEGEDTQLTVIESTVIKDTVPDDGFHETNHNILLAPNG